MTERKHESVYTSNMKEAYQFAVLLNVTKGVEDVCVERVNKHEYYVKYSREDNGEMLDVIMSIAKEYTLEGLNL